jgi:hypothetical protein
MQIKCTSCGATQELAANHQCGYCGSAIEQEKAQENYKASTTGEVGNLMMMAETAVDATNWEEALRYYNKSLEKDITNSDAWLGKGIAMVYTSKIGDIKTKEAIAYWKNAIKHAENADAMGKRVAKEINTVVNAFYPAIENHYIEFHDLDNSYAELISRFTALESAQDYAIQLNSENIEFCQTGYALCQRVINLSEKRFYKGFGKTIREIQRKYILLIENIDTNNPLVLEKRKSDDIEIKIQKEMAHEKEHGHFYFFGLIGGAVVGAFIAIPISHIVEIPNGVLMTLSVVLFVVLGLFGADKMVKGKAK